MKVAFDEHVPTTLAKVFIALAKERAIRRVSGDLIFEKAKDYAPQVGARDYIRKSDAPWLDRFAAAAGHAIISGDIRMRERVHERLALYQHGFVVIFFEAQWGHWNFFRKTALMLYWWEEICAKIKRGEPGTFWAVPAAWPPDGGELRNVSLGLAQVLKDRPKVEKKRSRKRRHSAATKPVDDRQRRLLFEPRENRRAQDEEGQ